MNVCPDLPGRLVWSLRDSEALSVLFLLRWLQEGFFGQCWDIWLYMAIYFVYIYIQYSANLHTKEHGTYRMSFRRSVRGALVFDQGHIVTASFGSNRWWKTIFRSAHHGQRPLLWMWSKCNRLCPCRAQKEVSWMLALQRHPWEATVVGLCSKSLRLEGQTKVVQPDPRQVEVTWNVPVTLRAMRHVLVMMLLGVWPGLIRRFT